nr:MAG TPA: hypothetical protein [Bacteriophage sp.]
MQIQANLIILPLHEGGIFIPKIKESEEKQWNPKRKLPKRRRRPTLPQRSRRTSQSPKKSPPKTSRQTITARREKRRLRQVKLL